MATFHPCGPMPHHRVLQTSELDEALELAARAWRPYRCVRAPRRRPFRWEIQHVRGRSVAITCFDGDADLDIDVGELDGFYTVHVSLEGAAEHHAGRDALVCGSRTAVVHSPGIPVRYRREGRGRFLVVRIEEAALLGELEGLLGTGVGAGALRFEPRMDLRGPAGRFEALSRVLAGRLDALRPGSGIPFALVQLEKTLLSVLLQSHPHSSSAALRGTGTDAGSTALRRAEEFVRAHLQHPLSAGDIARVAGVSARTLYRGFRRAHGCSPMDYVRRARLANVRRELQSAAPGTTVTDTALSWGFGHLGRFAGSYRSAFGETPSQTLVRGRKH